MVSSIVYCLIFKYTNWHFRWLVVRCIWNKFFWINFHIYNDLFLIVCTEYFRYIFNKKFLNPLENSKIWNKKCQTISCSNWFVHYCVKLEFINNFKLANFFSLKYLYLFISWIFSIFLTLVLLQDVLCT